MRGFGRCRRAAARCAGARGTVRRQLRTGLPAPIVAATAGRAGSAVLLPARGPGRKRQQTVFGRRLSVRPVRRLLLALGGARRFRPARPRPRAGRATAGRRDVPLLRLLGHRPGCAMGRTAAHPRHRHGLRHRACRQFVYADGIDLQRAVVGIGLSCRLCDRQGCRSRAFPPLEHRLALDPTLGSDSPYRFESKET